MFGYRHTRLVELICKQAPVIFLDDDQLQTLIDCLDRLRYRDETLEGIWRLRSSATTTSHEI